MPLQTSQLILQPANGKNSQNWTTVLDGAKIYISALRKNILTLQLSSFSYFVLAITIDYVSEA